MKFKFYTVLASAIMLPSFAISQSVDEVIVDVDRNTNLSISVYNDNLALIKDTRKVDLKKGDNSVAFVGVASQMKPETAIISAKGVKVTEQNYDYNVINYNSILKEYVGKKVKTALTNHETGATTFSEAVVVESEYGAVLKFDYGIETQFPGRVVFDELPKNLRTKPTFVANLNNDSASSKDIELKYLTNGMTWKADYIANIKDDKTLSLESFITLRNDSGVDYKDVSVQFVSGSISQVYNNSAPIMMQRQMMKSVYAAGVPEMDQMVAMDAGEGGYSATQGSVGDYHVYSAPNKTTIKNQQTKQIKLFSNDNVAFAKEYRFNSPLSFGLYSGSSEFLKSNPLVIYKITNNKDSNLNSPLPKGIVRFYQKDNVDSYQFIGESEIKQLAVGEEGELSLGFASDVFAKGKVAGSTVIAKDVKEIDIEITITNSKSEASNISFLQPIYDDWKIMSESHGSVKKNQNTASWELSVPAKDSVLLKFKVRVSRHN